MKFDSSLYRVVGIGTHFLESDDELEKQFQKYLRKNRVREDDTSTVWYDVENNVLFGSSENYSNTVSYDTCFLTDKADFLRSSRYGLAAFHKCENYGYDMSSLVAEENFIYESVPFCNNIRGKSVLVIGSGPSMEGISEEIYNKYDCVVVCNDFYMSDKVPLDKIGLVYISNTGQQNKKIIETVKDMDASVCMDLAVTRDPALTREQKKLFGDRMFLFSTRMFTTIGTNQRLIAILSHAGASKVGFIGMDGKTKEEYESNECYTAHGSTKKTIPPSQNYNSQNREYILFWEYMLQDVETPVLFENHGFELPSNVTAKIFHTREFSKFENEGRFRG